MKMNTRGNDVRDSESMRNSYDKRTKRGWWSGRESRREAIVVSCGVTIILWIYEMVKEKSPPTPRRGLFHGFPCSLSLWVYIIISKFYIKN